MKIYSIIAILILIFLVSSCVLEAEPIEDQKTEEIIEVKIDESETIEPENKTEIVEQDTTETMSELVDESKIDQENKSEEIKTEIITENKSDLNQTLINNLNQKLVELKIEKKEYDIYLNELDIEMEPDLSEWE